MLGVKVVWCPSCWLHPIRPVLLVLTVGFTWPPGVNGYSPGQDVVLFGADCEGDA